MSIQTQQQSVQTKASIKQKYEDKYSNDHCNVEVTGYGDTYIIIHITAHDNDVPTWTPSMSYYHSERTMKSILRQLKKTATPVHRAGVHINEPEYHIIHVLPTGVHAWEDGNTSVAWA